MKRIICIVTIILAFGASAYSKNSENSEADKLLKESYELYRNGDKKGSSLKIKEACDKYQNGSACIVTGWAYKFGKMEGIKKDINEALRYYGMACEKDIKQACTEIGRMYMVGDEVPKDLKKAIKHLNKGCKLDDGKGCYLAGGIHEDAKKYDTAIKYYEKSCNLNFPDGCSAIGVLYTGLIGNFPANIPKAIEYLTKSCDLKSAYGCWTTGRVYSMQDEYMKAKEFFERSCNLKYPCGCNELGKLYKKGLGVETDNAKYKNYMDLSKQYGGCKKN